MISLATKYDLINAALFLPSGGSGRLRQALVAKLAVKRGERVLELGCGTGQVTARLLNAGARVVAVDALPAMLDAARRRAPQATFVLGDFEAADVGADFDRVILSFVLHNFDAAGRRRVLAKAVGVLRSGGSVGILDWAQPEQRALASLWRRFLTRLEPSQSVTEILDGGLEADLASAGLVTTSHRRVSLSRAQIIIARAS